MKDCGCGRGDACQYDDMPRTMPSGDPPRPFPVHSITIEEMSDRTLRVRTHGARWGRGVFATDSLDEVIHHVEANLRGRHHR